MGTKDRLAALRAQAVYTPDEENDNSSVVIMVAGVKENLSAFEIEVEKLKTCLGTIEDDINRIVKLYSIDLNNYKACQENKPIIDELMNDIRLNASTIRNKLREFDDDLERLKKKGQTGAEFRIKKNQHSFLLNTFKNLMTKYNDVQIEYRDKCKRRIQTELEITGKKVSDHELESMIETGELEVFTENYQINDQKAKQAIDDLKRQKQELENLESSIRQVHQFFTDIAELIEHQGALIDRIEFQVSNAREYAQDGVQQTKEALEHHRAFVKKKLCCYSVLAVIVIVFSFYAFYELFGSSSNAKK